jgi:hypothetical protein
VENGFVFLRHAFSIGEISTEKEKMDMMKQSPVLSSTPLPYAYTSSSSLISSFPFASFVSSLGGPRVFLRLIDLANDSQTLSIAIDCLLAYFEAVPNALQVVDGEGLWTVLFWLIIQRVSWFNCRCVFFFFS